MTLDHKFSKTNASSILELLQANSTFIVPRFQRNYSWDKDRVETLWNDIMENFMICKDNNERILESQYLLGPIVLVNGKKQSQFVVIDGQQRLATLTMLFCVARDIILEYEKSTGDAKLSKGIEKINVLLENTQMDKHVGWKLDLNDTDKILFREIQEFENDCETSQLERIKKLPTKKIASHKNLKNNYIFLHNEMMKSLLTNFDPTKYNDYKDWDDKKCEETRIKNIPMLKYFLTYIACQNFIVTIMVSDDDTAFQIFETLNYRNEPLSKSDLIKNHLLNLISREQQELLSNRWNTIFNDVIKQGQRDDDFIMESLRSRYPCIEKLNIKYIDKITRNNLYKIIKELFNDEKKCKQYVKNLEIDASFLSMLNDPLLYDVDEKTKDDIYALQTLDAKLVRIPILTAYRKWGINDDYKTLVPFLVKFFFRYRTVGQTHPTNVEQLMLEITQIILDGKSLKDIIIKIQKNDNQYFENDFKKFMNKPSSKAAKYVLHEITMHLGTDSDDVRPIDKLTLEHILPQKFELWNEKDFFGVAKLDQNMNDYVTKLGNLTLLKNAINSNIKNEPFKNKKESGYEKSLLKINIETVCNESEWTAEIIKKREEKFTDYAVNIWNLDTILN